MLNSHIKSQIKSHSLENPKEECCGFILFANGEYSVFPCQNRAENPAHNFSIDGQDYLNASFKGDIVACYHSHCFDEKNYSDIDKVNSNGFNIPLILYHIQSDEFFTYYPNNESNKYIGQSFQIGVSDCFSLVREYYEKELGIKIRDYYRDDKWMTKSQYYFDTQYEQEGFVKVSFDKTNFDNMKKHDIILVKHQVLIDFPHATHAAIYLGHNQILHHIRDGYSKIEDYSDSYKRRTMMILRHNTLC